MENRKPAESRGREPPLTLKSRITALTVGIVVLGCSSHPRQPAIEKRQQALSTTPTTFIAKGSTWRYLDSGTDPGTSWRNVGFTDEGWKKGPAQLGYGDGDEATVVGFGPYESAKYVTTYFRRTFMVSDPTQVMAMTLNLLRDDGAVVYLNGTEITRSNMPPGTVGASTLATLAIGGADEGLFSATTVSSSSLISGTNVLAVEVHQSSGNSSDLSFDLELTGTMYVPPTQAMLVGTQGAWRYLDDGSDQGAAWRASTFNDAAWKSGVAQLGYGEASEHGL